MTAPPPKWMIDTTRSNRDGLDVTMETMLTANEPVDGIIQQVGQLLCDETGAAAVEYMRQIADDGDGARATARVILAAAVVGLVESWDRVVPSG